MKERETVRRIMRPFMSGIAYIHALGVIHRDIKLENTLFSADGTLKIADFGLSVDLSVEAPVTRLGTLDYMSPGAFLRTLLKMRPSGIGIRSSAHAILGILNSYVAYPSS